jgi:leucyl-tRNA synthetase
MKDYDHKKIEPKWQKYWDKKKLYKAKENSKKQKFFGLIEFPYPSGDGLHVGHIRSNTAMDIITRKRRAEGYEVLYPIGWDAFGLPTENYAIKTGIHPTVVTKNNTDKFRKQLKALGFGFDWDREVNTTDPEYYKWTQWIFLKFLEKGLAYKKKMAINWCPKDKIGLANEEVVDGKCERCGTVVEKREKEQWMLAITKYAERLDKDLDKKKILIGTRNPAKVKLMKYFFSDVPGIELISLNDLPPVDDSGLVEGDDFKENARMKSEFYFKKTGIPTISSDHILWIEKWPENNGYMVHIRKHANPQSDRATDEEVVVFLKNFLKTIGGKSKANFHYAFAYTDEKGVLEADEVPNKYILQEEQAKSFWPGFPTEAFLKDEKTGVFKSEQSDEVRYGKVKEIVSKKFGPRMTEGAGATEYLEKIRTQQKNWIGKSQGMTFKAKVKDTDLTIETFSAHFEAFCADTFVVIAPDHPFLPTLLKGVPNADQIMQFAKEIIAKRILRGNDEEKESEGIFTGRYIVDPIGSGDLPIWISSYALADYGTGIVKCSAHDERDFKFAKKYNIKLKTVLYPSDPILAEKVKKQEVCFTDMEHGVLSEPDQFAGKIAKSERQNIIGYLESKNLAKATTTFKLRDWVFSRQRYWGEPIPVIHCEKCGIVPVPEKDLPVKLPNVENYKPTDNGESPLAAISKWVNVKCPKCKSPAKRETDTMPNWAGSSWYYLRYTDAKNKKAFAGPKALKYWTPVDWYNGGMEHTTLHLLYSRFWHKFLFDLGLVPTSEPYTKRTSHGLILGEGGVKMSKSLGNVVNPDQLIETFGADTLRLYEMFMGPFDQPIAWSTESLVGPRRFLERVWRLQEKVAKDKTVNRNESLEVAIHKTIKKVGEDIENLRFNTAVSSLMVLLNDLEKSEKVLESHYKIFLQLLAPFAPHISEELWSIIGSKKTIQVFPWPAYDANLASKISGTIAVSINGKVRTEASFEDTMSEEQVRNMVFEMPVVKKWIEGKTVKKVIYVKGKLINIVVV